MSPGGNEAAIIGTSTWGTTLGLVLGRKGVSVALWARTEEEAKRLNNEKENSHRLPGFPFPPELAATASLDRALDRAGLVILAVPSKDMRHSAALISPFLDESKLVLSVAKGLEIESAKRMSQVVSEEIDRSCHPNICVLSGPNLAKEIARGLPATTVIAAYDATVAARAQNIMASSLFRVYVNTDVVGVELAGVLKNVIALAAGMVDGLELGDNAKSGLMTRGLTEITRLGVAAGANPLTFAGLAGLGDLVATCSSRLSRNRHVGQELARGRALDEVLDTMAGTAEGVTATVAALKLARDLGVDMPVAEEVHRVLYEGVDVRQAMANLMKRELKHEYADIMRRQPG
jgi:glycerol-3-phosphate dehydrogenase (NAD(P)+)